MHVYLCMHTRAFVHIGLYVFIYLCMHVYVSMLCRYVGIDVLMCLLRLYACMRMGVHMCVYTHMRTYPIRLNVTCTITIHRAVLGGETWRLRGIFSNGFGGKRAA